MSQVFKKGQMVRTELSLYRKEGEEQEKENVYGIVKDIRYKSEIAFLEFLPLHKLENRWVAFSSLFPAYT